MTVYDASIDPVVMAQSLYPIIAVMFGLAIVTAVGFGFYYSKECSGDRCVKI